jgi:hypothetical protein
METILDCYKQTKIKEEDFRQLSERDRRMLVQRFIDQIIYNSEKFKTAVRLLEKWENNS